MAAAAHAQPRCLGGAGLASERELDEQAARARGVTMWYSQYVRILKKLTKRTPAALSGFCGSGGSDEGVRRCGGTSVGFDQVDQPEFRRRFGEESFSLGDGVEQEAWRRRDAAARPFVWTAGPPCKWYSTGRAGEPTQPPLITETRDVLQRGGRLWWIENVMGAASHMSSEALVLRGCHFGLRVDRGRRFETNFRVHLDAALRAGEALRPRTCLGERRRRLRIDPYGRPVREPCCAGNLFAIQGTGPTGSTLAANAAAMWGSTLGTWGGHASRSPFPQRFVEHDNETSKTGVSRVMCACQVRRPGRGGGAARRHHRGVLGGGGHRGGHGAGGRLERAAARLLGDPAAPSRPAP